MRFTPLLASALMLASALPASASTPVAVLEDACGTTDHQVSTPLGTQTASDPLSDDYDIERISVFAEVDGTTTFAMQLCNEPEYGEGAVPFAEFAVLWSFDPSSVGVAEGAQCHVQVDFSSGNTPRRPGRIAGQSAFVDAFCVADEGFSRIAYADLTLGEDVVIDGDRITWTIPADLPVSEGLTTSASSFTTPGSTLAGMFGRAGGLNDSSQDPSYGVPGVVEVTPSDFDDVTGTIDVVLPHDA